MTIILRKVESNSDRRRFVEFPIQIYRNDRYWVQPITEDTLAKLSPEKNPFWRTAEQALWMAWKDGKPAGTIAGIIDHHGNQALREKIGCFGFFECVDDDEVAKLLIETAADWLASQSCTRMRGPYRPSTADESGILIEGFQTRPAILMGHNPPYYQKFFEQNGFIKWDDLLARMWLRPAGFDHIKDALPNKLVRVADIARKRPDLRIRSIRLAQWDSEIRTACEIYNQALSSLPDYTPITEAEFMVMADGFKPLLDPQFALVAEVNQAPVAFALALPDINEALQHVHGRLDWIGLVKLWWYARRLKRISLKILMVLPTFQNRGIEAVLLMEIAEQIWRNNFQEVDLSLTGETNVKSSLFQENLGMNPYRRYRIYEKRL